MRKFFTILACLAALLCLTSCNLDKEGSFVFSYKATGSITNDLDREALAKYFEDNYMTEDKVVRFTCKTSEALEHALVLFEKDMEKVDDEYILSMLTYEEDFAVLTGLLTGDKLSTWVADRVWTYEMKDATEE